MKFRITYKVSYDGSSRRLRKTCIKYFEVDSVKDAEERVTEWKNKGDLFVYHVVRRNPKLETKILLEKIESVCEI